jgi:hypothetical protein
MDFDIHIIQKHRAVGGDIRLFNEVASTNDARRELAKARAPEGTVVIADEQTAGHELRPRRVSPAARSARHAAASPDGRGSAVRLGDS